MGTRTEELQAAGRLAGGAIAAGVGLVSGMHEAITIRVADRLPPPGRQIALLQGAIAQAIYSTISQAHRAVPVSAGHALAITSGPSLI